MHLPPMHHPPHPPLGVGLACVPPMRSNPPLPTTTLGVGFVCLPPPLYVTPPPHPPGTPCSYRRVSTCPSGLGCRGMSLSGAIGMGEGGGEGARGSHRHVPLGSLSSFATFLRLAAGLLDPRR